MYVSHCTVLLMFTGVLLKKKLKKQNHSFVVVFLWKEKKEKVTKVVGGLWPKHCRDDL